MSGKVTRFNDISSDYIGAVCAEFRRQYTYDTQEDVAESVGCSRESVSRFERGLNTNSIIFLWYIKRGVFDFRPPDRWNGWGKYYGFI